MIKKETQNNESSVTKAKDIIKNRVMKDSGARQQFDGGAVRDTDEGKRKWHLVSPYLKFLMGMPPKTETDLEQAFKDIARFQICKDISFLIKAFIALDGQYEDMIIWLEAGAKKYSHRNWEKGMNIDRCVDSLDRHMKALFAGKDDEDHKAAAKCNIMFILHYICAIKDGSLDAKWDNLPEYKK